MIISKSDARALALEHRNRINRLSHSQKSIIIIDKIKNLDVYKKASIVAIYYPIRNEVDLRELLYDNKTFLFPRTYKNFQMDFIKVDDKTIWERNKFGIFEPQNGIIINEGIDLMLIPCLAKNNRNLRLGYGAGFYDRFLFKHNVDFKVGILMDDLTYNFIGEDFDIKLDLFISN